ncbi:putative nuclease HARBI1, partial [Aphis craccivora]
MIDTDDEVIIASAAYIVISIIVKKKKKSKIKKKRRFWVSDIFKNRVRYSGTDLLNDLKMNEAIHFSNFCRMNNSDFEMLLKLIGPKIAKSDSHFRKAIPANERLLVTLRYLASGDSFHSLAYLFKFSKQVISNIIPQVCEALIEVLSEYIQMPQTPEKWLNVSKRFFDQWNFPNCLGSMDGKYVVLQAPIHSGTEFFNYNATFSIVLFALVDADYNFLFADVGCQGRISDGGMLKNSILYEKLENCELGIPNPQPLFGRNRSVPYVFVADGAFGLHDNIMKPYPGVQEKSSKKRVFNYRFSRARRVVENSLRKPLLLQPDKAEKIVLACCYMHNYLRKKSTSINIYTPNGVFDHEQDGQIIPGNWRREGQPSSLLPLQRVGRKSSQSSQSIRDEFANYFHTNGRVAWQDQF